MEAITRRGFTGRMLAGAGAVYLAGVNTACWLSGSVFASIMTYVGIGLTAFQAVVSLLDPPLALALAGTIALVKAGFADLQLAVQDYNNAPAADKTTLKNRIAVVLQDLQFEIQKFWSNLNLPGPLGTLVEGLLNIILSTLAGFAGQLPAPITPPASVEKMKALAKTITVTPQVRNKSQFESDFNAKWAASGRPPVKFSK